MPARKLDPFAQARRQAEKALSLLNQEIQRAEGELKGLLSQASAWRSALSGLGTPRRGRVGRPPGRKSPGAHRAATRRANRKAVSAKPRGGRRVDWEGVLSSVPRKFGVEDVIRHPGARAKGRAQIYPALSRWLDAKKIKRIDKGRYQKV